MFVQQQELRLLQGGHQQRQCLTLSAGQKTCLHGHPVFQAKAQNFQPFPVKGPLLFRHAPPKAPLLSPAIGKGQIFLNLHIGGRAHHGVLEYPPDKGRAAKFRQAGHVRPVDEDAPLIHGPHARHRVEHGGLARAVAANDGDKIPLAKVEVKALKGFFFVDGAGVKGLADMVDVKHACSPPSLRLCPAGLPA